MMPTPALLRGYPYPMNQPAFPINAELHPDSRNWRARRFRYWYDSIIDFLLAEPMLTQKEIAFRMGKSPVTIGLIMNSDIFRARYEMRRLAMSEALQQSINGKLQALAIDAIDATHEKLKLKRDLIPFEDLVDVTDKTLTRLGYGAKQSAQTAVVINNNAQVTAPISSEDLERSREKLLNSQRAKTIEGTFTAGESALAPAANPLAAEVDAEKL